MTFRTLELSPPSPTMEGLRFVTVKSPALRRRGDLTLWEPDHAEPGNGPLVILLHGVYGSHWSWALKGNAHRTAARLISAGTVQPMALAMPSDGLWGDGSGYLRHGDADYERWIVEEIPAIARKVLRSVGNHSSIYLSGLSMGGYGALRLGALHSAKFRGVSAHSSITEIHQLGEFVEEPVSPLLRTAGCTSVLAAIKAHSHSLPPIRFDCGASDPLIEPNRALHQALDDASIEHVYQEFPGGHQWAYWEEHLSDTLRFFAEIERQR